VAQDVDIYVSDAGNFDRPPWKILRYDGNGDNPAVFINQQLAWPQDILFLEDRGVVLVSSLNSGRITRHNAVTGAFIDDFATGIAGPTRMKIGPDGLIYVLQWAGDGRVLRFRPDGTALGAFTSVGVAQGIGIAWDAQGRLYVSSYSQDLVRRFDANGADLGVFVGSNLAGPTNIWFDATGDLLVSDYDGGSIKRFSAAGAFEGVFIGGLGQSEGIDFLPNGNLLVGNGATGAVKMYGSSGAFVEDLVSPGAGGLIRPNAVVVRAKQSAFVVNSGLNDAWFNAATPGQGFFVSVFPQTGLMFVGWFTYEAAGRPAQPPPATLGEPFHRWLTASGGWNGNVASLDVYLTSGGVFDAPNPVTNTKVGTATITFHGCNSATLDYALNGIAPGRIALTRLANDNVALCESLQ
jgi:sugar lactone lactonase YvrE